MTNAYHPARLRHLAWAGHLLALVFVAVPGSALVLSWVLSEATGPMARAQAFGMAGTASPLLLFGLLLSLAIATWTDQRRLRWVLGIGILALGVIVAVSIPLFALDALQLRPDVAPGMMRTYTLNVVRNFLTLSLSAIVLLATGILALRALRREPREAEPPATAALVGSTRTRGTGSGSPKG